MGWGTTTVAPTFSRTDTAERAEKRGDGKGEPGFRNNRDSALWTVKTWLTSQTTKTTLDPGPQRCRPAPFHLVLQPAPWPLVPVVLVTSDIYSFRSHLLAMPPAPHPVFHEATPAQLRCCFPTMGCGDAGQSPVRTGRRAAVERVGPESHDGRMLGSQDGWGAASVSD